PALTPPAAAKADPAGALAVTVLSVIWLSVIDQGPPDPIPAESAHAQAVETAGTVAATWLLLTRLSRSVSTPSSQMPPQKATASPRLLLTVTLLPVMVLLRIVATAQPSDGLAQLSSPPMWIPPAFASGPTLFGNAVVSCALLLLMMLPSIVSSGPLFKMPPPSAERPFGALATA